MAFAPGTKCGSYEVIALLGSGGMGEVYRARDPRLKREVAIKTLPHGFADDPDRLSRFQREAEVLASLNHPNIAAIHHIEEADGSRFLVLELVEGETLAERIARGPIPVDDALKIARQIAEAIEAANAKGIIHRDLKPANVKITPDGKVKVLDFGLAKIYQEGPAPAGPSQSPTLMSGSMPGMIVGTAAYMSPEQARGHAADAQADIWAFGCVLYEMLTGQHTFQGDTIADIFASIMKSEPHWDALPQQTPSPILSLLRRCLQKDRSRRMRNMGDAALEIDEALSDPRRQPVAAPPAARSWTAYVLLTGLIALLIAGAVFFAPRNGPAPDTRTIRFSVPPPERFFKRGESAEFALSPDGRYLAFTAEGTTRKLWIRSLDSSEARPISGTDTDNSMLPFWSPDSRYVGFYRNNKLSKVAIADGRTELICDVAGFATSTWSRDNVIVYAVEGKLYRVSGNGGEPQPLTAAAGAGLPQFLPDGDHLLFGVRSRQSDVAGFWLMSLKSDERKRILPLATFAAYSPTGHLLYIRDGKLFAQAFDSSKLELTGEPTLLTKEAAATDFVDNFSVSSNGTLAWSGRPTRAAQIVWRDRSGKLLNVALKSGLYRQIRLSPDAARAAVVTTNSQTNQDIWLLEISNGVFSRLTSSAANENDMVWSPDGRELAFTSRGNLYRKTIDAADVKPLLESKENKWLHDWSPDGRYLVYAHDKGVYALPLSGEPRPVTLVENDFSKDEFRVSHDGHWVAYNSTESGRSEIYVASFPKFDHRRQVSNSGGAIPRWRDDTREMYYLRLDGTLMAVDVRPGDALETGPPHELFRVEVPVSTVLDQYDVTGDGKRFIIIENEENATSPPINIVVNWAAELQPPPDGKR